MRASVRLRQRLSGGSPPREALVARHVQGRSFVDVGCMWSVDGAIAFAAEEAGAARVTGVDVMGESDAWRAEHTRRSSQVRFVQGDLHDPATVEAIGVHDVVWCSGVLYHAPHPLLTLERLRAMTSATLILATETLPLRGNRCEFAPAPGTHPTHTEPFDPARGYVNWFWGISPGALRAMVEATGFRVEEEHRTAFHTTVVASAGLRGPATDTIRTMATEEERLTVAPIVGPDDPRHFTDSGIEMEALYGPEDVRENLPERLGAPGEYPYTRGPHKEMYRKQVWTMRQYAGYASAKESNERYRYLIGRGATGLSMAFDLPTQLGLDSDNPRCLGEVGRTGVAIDTIDDMRTAFDEIPLDKISTSMTINAPAAVLLALYELVGEEQGVPSKELRGTTQNDILKEYIARGNYIFPPEASMRLTTDLFAYCKENVPRWNTVSISGYHFREKGCSAVQEVAFTLSSGIAYVQAAIDAGLAVDDFAPRLAFFFNGHNNVFQEVAKFRAARRMWALIMKERFGAENPKSMMLRFHTQTGGVTLTAQQPVNNIVRVALQGFAAVCGGTQSLHTNGFDEALALPSETAAKTALRTQQILAHESGAADTVDPFAGSYFVEALTDEIESRALELITKVDELGGSVKAIEFITGEIDESAWGYQERYRIAQDIVVGVNKYEEEELEVPDLLRVDPDSERAQLERLAAFKENRDQEKVEAALSTLREAAAGKENLVPHIKDALRDRASMGEVCGAMQDVFGKYAPTF